MSVPGVKSRYVAVVCGVLGLLALVEPAAAQDVGATETGLSPVAEAAVGMGLTLVVGGLLVGIFSEFTEGFIDTMHRRLVSSFVIGLIPLVILGVAIATIPPLGILLAIPFIPVMLVVTPLGYIALARVFTLSWAGSLLVAVVLAGLVTAVPVLGPVASFVTGTTALGAYFVHLGGPDTREAKRRTA